MQNILTELASTAAFEPADRKSALKKKMQNIPDTSNPQGSGGLLCGECPQGYARDQPLI